jgi:tripartite-type tricarboxylate transporter receptor subunit TctC
VATEALVRSAPDGYTLLLQTNNFASNVTLYAGKLSFDSVKDTAPVSLVAGNPHVLVVNPAVPAKNLQEFIALAKAKPGALTYASSGPGSNKHLGGELFKLMSKTDILHVAYKGSTGARNDLMGGHVDMMFDEVPSSGPNVLAGQLRALGVTGAKRSPALPDIPTVSEAGLPGYEHTGWFGIMAPAATPKPILEKLSAEIKAVTERPDVRAAWDKQGVEPMYMAPAEFEAYLRAELEKWAKVVKAANIKLE